MSINLHEPVAEKDGLSLYFVGDVAVIVMDKGENRINLDVINNLNFLLDEVERNESCKGLVTIGKGRFYSNGLDIPLIKTVTPEETAQIVILFTRLLKRILMFPIPTIAAINGHAFADGAILAFIHDLRVMRNDRGWISLNEVFLNVGLLDSVREIMRSKMGDGQNLTDSLVLGGRYTAEDAFKRGLVHAVSSEALLITDAVRVLKSFSGKDGYRRENLAAMKRSVYSQMLESLNSFLTSLTEKSEQLVLHKTLSRL